MNVGFEYRPLLDADSLRCLHERRDAPSLIRLTLHLGALVFCSVLLVSVSAFPIVAVPVAFCLAAILQSFFWPLHECTHQTAFRSSALNTIGAWITGISYGVAPSVYRAFHFAHHRYTNIPKKDPELSGDPDDVGDWPTDILGWLLMIFGWWHLKFKIVSLVKLAILPAARWDEFAPWAPPEQRSRLAWETRIVASLWLALVMALIGIPGTRWLLFALLLSHMFQAVGHTAEHRGLPNEGAIFARTRTIRSPRFVRWWLWNANYHAEHHAWPGIPWHELPKVHRRIAEHVADHGQSFWGLQFQVLRSKGFLPKSVDLGAMRRQGD